MQIPKRKNDHLNEIKFDPNITQSKLDELQKDYDRMIIKVRPKLSAEVKRLAELGDFSENAEYQLAKGKLRGLNNRAENIKFRIDHAKIIKPNNDTSRVSLGHFVTIKKGGIEKTYQILGSFETNPTSGSISDSSPLGSELLNKKVGDNFSMVINDKKTNIKIVAIK